ncbi:unnamed protein product [Sphenostylis stenocarpa]|uniref:Transcription factor CBF/NF-Y/archaeal histone domain-containing protein n=1 Tax=Sphenostylis stenocarpa TaxID=92480 RepID=A0AA86S143_9FABA|nr:unnamed protein product [Sphenostylis stenocarpa]
MEDESHGTLPNGFNSGSPESPCLKTTNSNSNTTTTTTPTTHTNNNNIINNHNNNNNTNHNKEQDRFLPIANVGRIMKKVIPSNGKISKDAKETVQECVSEFISFVTGEASDKCQREKRKTINGDDVIWAITTLGFEDYVEPLKIYLQKYKEIEGEKLNIPKQLRSEQRLQQHQQNNTNNNNNNNNNNINNNNVNNQDETNQQFNAAYASQNLISQPPYVATDQKFSLPFSPNSIQNHQIDSKKQRLKLFVHFELRFVLNLFSQKRWLHVMDVSHGVSETCIAKLIVRFIVLEN